MTQKYIRGAKRNQIIQRWLQGIEDPDWEVFPTKKEGKYIVKLRDQFEKQTSSNEPNDSQSEVNEVNEQSIKQNLCNKPPVKQFSNQTSSNKSIHSTQNEALNH